MREKLAAPDATLLVAERDGAIVGMALAEPHADDARALHLSMVFVEPDHWGAGVGRALLDALLAHARRGGAPGVSVWTAADNARGRRLYAAAGFAPTGDERPLDGARTMLRYAADLTC